MESLLLILIGVLSRLLPHPANMTAISSIALFSGARMSVKKALVTTLASMVISDGVLGYHPVMWATYGCLVIAIMLGQSLTKTHPFGKIAAVTMVSSCIFYLVTNFAVWAQPHSMYPNTAIGLFDSYIMALPFFRNSVIGDMSYAFVFFGLYELAIYKRVLSEINKLYDRSY